jgi:hypothetical protein
MVTMIVGIITGGGGVSCSVPINRRRQFNPLSRRRRATAARPRAARRWVITDPLDRKWCYYYPP